MTVCIVDTSVLVELLDLPHMNARHAQVEVDLRAKLERSETMLLPMAAIVETGNHVGQVNGDRRRLCAERFVTFVGDAIDGRAPFVATPMYAPTELRAWLSTFVDWASRGIGFGDLSIKEEWERQRARHTQRRVYIWSFDQHLQGYDTGEP